MSKKLTEITKAANNPNDTIGIIGLMQVARKETAVVTEVTSIAFVAFLIVYANLKISLFLRIRIQLVCCH
jgi:hypothetical protein